MDTQSRSCGGCTATAEQLVSTPDAALRKIMGAVFAINVALFTGETLAGWWADSSALQADALDSLGDAAVYALSFIAVGRSLRWRAGAAMVKGVIQGLFGLAVLAEVARRVLGGAVPDAGIMAAAAAIALVGNLICFALLWRRRDQDINMRSVWLCSRNDVINNVGVIVASGLVLLVDHGAPDWIIGVLIATLFLRTSFVVLREALQQWRRPVGPDNRRTCA